MYLPVPTPNPQQWLACFGDELCRLALGRVADADPAAMPAARARIRLLSDAHGRHAGVGTRHVASPASNIPPFPFSAEKRNA